MSEIVVLPDAGESAGISYQIDYRPVYALATVRLAAEQSIKTESGATRSLGAFANSLMPYLPDKSSGVSVNDEF